MLKALRKEIDNDYKQLRLDVEKNDVFNLVSILTEKSNLSSSQKNMILKHMKRYHKLCQKDYNLRFERTYDKINSFLSSGGKMDHEVSEMLNFIDENLINDIYGLKAFNVYKALKDENAKDKFYNGLLAIENNKKITSDIAEVRKEKYINSYFENLKLNKR